RRGGDRDRARGDAARTRAGAGIEGPRGRCIARAARRAAARNRRPGGPAYGPTGMSEKTATDRRLAVALEYEAGSRTAPRVTAKGYGLVAEAIVALAQENDVVIDANPALAQALAGVELDETIPVELFEAVAE